MQQSYIIILRCIDGYEGIYSTNDLKKAICIQKALSEKNEPNAEDIRSAKETITDDEFNFVQENINNASRDRISNNEKEVYIFYLPAWGSGKLK